MLKANERSWFYSLISDCITGCVKQKGKQFIRAFSQVTQVLQVSHREGLLSCMVEWECL